jgi:hypothetical protein
MRVNRMPFYGAAVDVERERGRWNKAWHGAGDFVPQNPIGLFADRPMEQVSQPLSCGHVLRGGISQAYQRFGI